MGKAQSPKITCEECDRSVDQAGTLCIQCREDLKLFKEKVTACPPLLDAKAFERFIRKLAVHAYVKRTEAAKGITLDLMEIRLMQAVVEALPAYYVSIFEYGPERQRQTGRHGSYTIKASIPQNVLYRTVEGLDLWVRQEPKDGGGLSEA